MIEKPSPNYDERKQGEIKYLIMHYTGMASGDEAIDRLCDGDAAVSAHYVVEENGDVYALVPEEYRAWHAGVSSCEGNTDINDLSIGIEIVNPGHPYPGYESIYREFTDDQMKSVLSLSRDIISRCGIKPWHVIGHSDVAWRRKIDPGELFNWKMLAEHGVGLYPEALQSDFATSNDKAAFFSNLTDFGYGEVDHEAEETDLISAFQRHFRPTKFDGILDQETCGIAQWLVQQKVS